MTRVAHGTAVVSLLAFLAGARALAQSTDKLTSLDRPTQFQISAGDDAVWGPLKSFALTATVRFHSYGTGGTRVSAWWVDVHDTHASSAGAGNPDQTSRRRDLALLLSVDWSLHIARDVAIEPILGVGYVLYARSTTEYNGYSNSFDDSGKFLVAAGASFRIHHAVIECHVSVGRQGGTLQPLTIGWRF